MFLISPKKTSGLQITPHLREIPRDHLWENIVPFTACYLVMTKFQPWNLLRIWKTVISSSMANLLPSIWSHFTSAKASIMAASALTNQLGRGLIDFLLKLGGIPKIMGLGDRNFNTSWCISVKFQQCTVIILLKVTWGTPANLYMQITEILYLRTTVMCEGQAVWDWGWGGCARSDFARSPGVCRKIRDHPTPSYIYDQKWLVLM